MTSFEESGAGRAGAGAVTAAGHRDGFGKRQGRGGGGEAGSGRRAGR